MRTTACCKSEAEAEYIVGSSDGSPSELLKQDSAELAELSPELREVVM